MGVDGKARVLAREPFFGLRETELVPQHIDQVRGVAAIEDAEAHVEADGRRMPPNESIRNRVKSARPRQSHLFNTVAFNKVADDALRTAGHFDRSATGKCKKKDAIG